VQLPQLKTMGKRNIEQKDEDEDRGCEIVGGVGCGRCCHCCRGGRLHWLKLIDLIIFLAVVGRRRFELMNQAIQRLKHFNEDIQSVVFSFLSLT